MTQVRCDVKGVFMAVSDKATVPLVILADSEGRLLPIYIGIWEAVSINSARNHEVLPRPFTHDLFLDLCGKFGIRLQSLQVDSIEDGVYYAQLVFTGDKNAEYLDCRPSDGIAIALRSGAPIFVEESVIATAASKEADLPHIVDLTSFLQK